MRRIASVASVVAIGVALGVASPARAQEGLEDYDPSSRAWNGLAGFVAIAQGLGFRVDAVSSLEWGDLGEDDVLLLLYPLQRVDPALLQVFLQAGGHALIADDFGASKDAMSRLALIGAEVASPQSARFHDGRSFAPIADARSSHPIADGVEAVVTNHPAVLTHVEGADVVMAFPSGEALVVAGERGAGRFVVVSDPSILINRMLQFPGNLRLATGMLRWLGRGGQAHRLVVLRGDVPMYGEPRPFIGGDAAGVGRGVADINRWLDESSEYLLMPITMRVIALGLAVVLGLIAVLALPAWRRGRSDGRWLRLERPPARDHMARAVATYDHGERNFLLPASVLRDVAQAALTKVTGRADPLYAIGERDLQERVTAARGPAAGAALHRVYKRLRALPTRSQAAAPWGGGSLTAGEFEQLHADVTALCRTLGEEIE